MDLHFFLFFFSRTDVLRDVERNVAAQVETPQALLRLALILFAFMLAQAAGEQANPKVFLIMFNKIH